MHQLGAGGGEKSFGECDEPVKEQKEFADRGRDCQRAFHLVFADGVLCFVACLLKKFFFMLLLFLYGKTAEAHGEDAKAMVTGVVGVPGDELVLDDVLEELTTVEVLQVGAVLS